MEEKFKKINLDLLPDNVKTRLLKIQEITDDFTNYIEKFEPKFNEIYSHIEKDHPEAVGLKPIVIEPKPVSENILYKTDITEGRFEEMRQQAKERIKRKY